MAAMEDTSPPTDAPEEKVWSGSPSQLLMTGRYLLWIVIFVVGVALGLLIETHGWTIGGIAMAVAVIGAAYTFLRVKCIRYELTSERIILSSGILSKSTEELELFRVKDSKLLQPLSQRIFGLGTIHLVTTDATTPVLILPAISGAADVREMIRKHVNTMRDRKKVRELDME